jgi:hypothetical protein
MLKKEQISKIKIYSDEWHVFRAGRFTSSRAHLFMGESGFTAGTMTYIYQKVGETLTGQITGSEDEQFEDEQFEDENTSWGLQNEPIALNLFQQVKKVQFMTNQNIIYDLENQFSSTPDAIWTHNESLCEKEYNVSTIEVKCPRKYHRYIPLFNCKTPADLKKFDKKYYWQVIDQGLLCDSAVSYFMCFNPMFPEKSRYNIIEFRKMDLWADYKLLHTRKMQAIKEFNQIRASMVGS